MGVGTISQGLYLSPIRQPCLQVPNLAPQFTTSPLINMQHGIPQFRYYVPMNIPLFPPYFSGFPPTRPPMEVVTEPYLCLQPRPLLYPQKLESPLQTFQYVYSSTPYQHPIIPPTNSQPGRTVPGLPSYHMPSTSQVGFVVRLMPVVFQI